MRESLFFYRAMDRSGKILKGELRAVSERRAVDTLRQRGDTIIELRPVALAGERLRLERSIDPKLGELADFARDVRDLLRSGLSLTRALSVMAEPSQPARIRSLAKMLHQTAITGGAPSEDLSAARSHDVRILGRFFAAAEAGGQHERMLAIAEKLLRARVELAKKVRESLGYPIFLIAVSMVAIFILTVLVAPAIAPLFDSGETPFFVLVMAELGEWMKRHMQSILLVLACALPGAYWLSRRPSLKRRFQALMFALPFIGPRLKDLAFAPAALACGGFLDTGWPTDQALAATARLAEGLPGEVFSRVHLAVRDGAQLSGAMRREQDVPQRLIQSIIIGEETANLSDGFTHGGERLLGHSVTWLERMSEILGPVIIAGIGGLTAWLMVSLMASITAIGDGVM